MKLGMKFFMLLGFVCLAVGLTGTAIAFKETDFNSGIINVDVDKTINAAGIDTLNIKTLYGGVAFIPSNTDEIKVRLVGTASETLAKDCTIDATEDSSTWTVNVCRKTNKFHIGIDINELKNLIANRENRLKTEVTIPDKMFKSINVKSDTGSIQLKNVKAEQLVVKSDTGAIALDRFEGNDLELRSDTGRITVGDGQGNVRLRTNTGSIETKLREVGDNVEIRTDTGSIKLQLGSVPPSVKFDLSSDVGRVTLDVPGVDLSENSRNAVMGTIGDGNKKVLAQTNTGSIKVEKY